MRVVLKLEEAVDEALLGIPLDLSGLRGEGRLPLQGVEGVARSSST